MLGPPWQASGKGSKSIALYALLSQKQMLSSVIPTARRGSRRWLSSVHRTIQNDTTLHLGSSVDFGVKSSRYTQPVMVIKSIPKKLPK